MSDHRRARRLRRGGAALLVCALLAGLTPAVPGAIAHAAAPGVTKFATKEELLSSFDLENSTEKPTQKVFFGNGGDGNAQTWYIAGKDPVADNGLVLMCDPTRPLIDSQQFYGGGNLGGYGYDPDWGCSYENAPTDVYANHYGGSDLRTALQSLETNNAYFSAEEQVLMEKTTITTDDTKNSGNYTTTDTLYAAYGDFELGNDAYITVGTDLGNLNGGLKIDLKPESPYARGSNFWLRAPYRSGKYGALYATVGLAVYPYTLYDENAVVPAFQLNLSSVLFASAAPAAPFSGTSVDDALTLRYESTSLGSAVINPEKTGVAVKGAPSGTYLVVQNDSSAWAKAVSGDITIAAGEVDSSLSSFTDCKVWLERTDTDRITTATLAMPGYKVTATPGSNMTRVAGFGDASQIVAKGSAIADIIYEADAGYYFPTDYAVPEINGISVTRKDYRQITVSGTPTDTVALTLSAATEKTDDQSAPSVTGGVESISGTTAAMEYAATADAAGWTGCADTATTVTAGTWYVRYKETDTQKAGPATKAVVMSPVFAITPVPAGKDFGAKNEGYAQPTAQTVTIENTGNSTVRLTPPTSVSYDIGTLTEADLAVGGTAVFTVRPKAGLPAGNYEETITVGTTQGTSAEVAVSFRVNGAFSVTIDPSSAEINAGDSQTLTANPTGGSKSYTYKWYAGDAPDVIGTEKGLTVSPTETITYKVVVTDTIEDREAAATVTVKPKTTITAGTASFPRTGDSSPLLLWLGLLFVSGGKMAIIGMRKRCKV